MTQQVAAGRPWDWRILANGRLDELGYERGQIDTSLPFPELKARSDITRKTKAADAALDFSSRIRKGLPGMDRGSLGKRETRAARIVGATASGSLRPSRRRIASLLCSGLGANPGK